MTHYLRNLDRYQPFCSKISFTVFIYYKDIAISTFCATEVQLWSWWGSAQPPWHFSLFFCSGFLIYFFSFPQDNKNDIVNIDWLPLISSLGQLWFWMWLGQVLNYIILCQLILLFLFHIIFLLNLWSWFSLQLCISNYLSWIVTDYDVAIIDLCTCYCLKL